MHGETGFADVRGEFVPGRDFVCAVLGPLTEPLCDGCIVAVGAGDHGENLLFRKFKVPEEYAVGGQRMTKGAGEIRIEGAGQVVAGFVDEPGQPHTVRQPRVGAPEVEAFHVRVVRRYGCRV